MNVLPSFDPEAELELELDPAVLVVASVPAIDSLNLNMEWYRPIHGGTRSAQLLHKSFCITNSKPRTTPVRGYMMLITPTAPVL
jgi:hypothetical protein